ncbi:MAG: peptidylprolyl isomerase [Gemmatimonadota bacterium]
MTRWLRAVGMLALVFSFAACSDDSDPAADDGDAQSVAEAPPAEAEPAGDPPDAPAVDDSEPAGGAVNPLMNPADPAMNEMAPASFRVRLTTTKGEVVLELHRAWAPNGVDRVYNLVRAGFYDGVRFFRVLDGFMAQFGINGDPAIQGRWRNAHIVDDPVVEGNAPGRLTFAKSNAPNSRSTQLFINYRNNSNLDAMGFAAIGEVVEGMDVVENLYSGYGEGGAAGSGATGPDQAAIQRRGNEYLAADFPELDYIEKAEIVDDKGEVVN